MCYDRPGCVYILTQYYDRFPSIRSLPHARSFCGKDDFACQNAESHSTRRTDFALQPALQGEAHS